MRTSNKKVRLFREKCQLTKSNGLVIYSLVKRLCLIFG